MTILGVELHSQKATYLNFPTLDTNLRSVDAEKLLAELDWSNVESFCDSTEGHYARKYEGEKITTYSYVRQGYAASFRLTVFQGKVLEYESHIDGRFSTNYFDRDLWLLYVDQDENFHNSEWNLTEEEMPSHYTEAIQAYYKLLGFNVRDEYGWICEYSAAGSPPEKRLAIIDLINYQRRDFLVKLLDHPNIQTKIYAADALIYLDMIGEIQTVRLENHKISKRAKNYNLQRTNSYKLTKQEWKKIWEIRDANYEVITCGNMGSYKQYRSTSKALLSDEAINEIYGNYLMFREIGYLWR